MINTVITFAMVAIAQTYGRLASGNCPVLGDCHTSYAPVNSGGYWGYSPLAWIFRGVGPYVASAIASTGGASGLRLAASPRGSGVATSSGTAAFGTALCPLSFLGVNTRSSSSKNTDLGIGSSTYVRDTCTDSSNLGTWGVNTEFSGSSADPLLPGYGPGAVTLGMDTGPSSFNPWKICFPGPPHGVDMCTCPACSGSDVGIGSSKFVLGTGTGLSTLGRWGVNTGSTASSAASLFPGYGHGAVALGTDTGSSSTGLWNVYPSGTADGADMYRPLAYSGSGLGISSNKLVFGTGAGLSTLGRCGESTGPAASAAFASPGYIGIGTGSSDFRLGVRPFGSTGSAALSANLLSGYGSTAGAMSSGTGSSNLGLWRVSSSGGDDAAVSSTAPTCNRCGFGIGSSRFVLGTGAGSGTLCNCGMNSGSVVSSSCSSPSNSLLGIDSGTLSYDTVSSPLSLCAANAGTTASFAGTSLGSGASTSVLGTGKGSYTLRRWGFRPSGLSGSVISSAVSSSSGSGLGTGAGTPSFGTGVSTFGVWGS